MKELLKKNLMVQYFVGYLKGVKSKKANQKLLKNKIELMENIKKLLDTGIGLEIKDDRKSWEISFNNLLEQKTGDFDEIVSGFFASDITLEKKNQNFMPDKVILIATTNNDIKKIKRLFEHYRSIGITNFAILDNQSLDGTFEWVSEQSDVDLFNVGVEFQATRHASWYTRVIAYYGINRYYLIVDSDEFFIYKNCEKIDINQYIEELKQYNYNTVRSFLLDMYGDDSFYEKGEEEHFVEECRYFDRSTYIQKKKNYPFPIEGGVRKRLMGVSPQLAKYSLVEFSEGDFYLPHFPLLMNPKCSEKLETILLHYKFLPSDIQKYDQYIAKKIHHEDSKEYLSYQDYLETEGFTFYDSKESKKLINYANVLEYFSSYFS